MSSTEKVERVASVRDEYGLTPALAAVELPKSTWYYHQNEKVSYAQKYGHLRPILEEIARCHPEYGYRRTQVELAEAYGYAYSQEVVRRLHRLWELRLLRTTQPPQPSLVRQVITEAGDRANLVAQMSDIGLFEVAYTDFTQLLLANGTRKAYLMPILGHQTKIVYGWAVGPQANTQTALRAWDRAKDTLQELAIPYTRMIIHHDQDPVYTGYDWTGQLVLKDEVRLSYVLNGAKDNPQMESFFSRFKAEGESLFLNAETINELRTVVAQRIAYYNRERRHSSLDYLSPLVYLAQVRSGSDWKSTGR